MSKKHADKEKFSFKKTFGTKSSKAGGYSLAVCAVAVIIAVLVNMIATTIPSKFTELDISAGDLYSLSDYSKQIAEKIDTDVTIYQLATKSNKDSTVSTLLDRYADLNSHIKVELRDPEISQIASEYTKDEVNANSLIFVSDKRSKVVDYADIYEYSEDAQMAAYYGQSVSPDLFDGESEITSALNYVTTDVLPKVYALTGHGEFELPAAVTSGVASENIELCDLDLTLQKTVPEDCACLLLMGPNIDITKDELQTILAYMENGGRIFIAALTASALQSKTPNFNSLLAEYGIEASEGFVIEGDETGYYYYPNYIVPTLDSHEITDPLIDSGYHAFMPMAQSFTLSDSYRSSLQITPLLSTSDKAFSRTDMQNSSVEKTAGDTDGPFDLAYAVSEAVGDKEMRAVIFSTPYFLDGDFASYAGDLNLFLNSLKWMCELEENISVVQTKALSSGGSLEVTGASTLGWSVLITVVLPIVAIVAGIVIYVRRKKR